MVVRLPNWLGDVLMARPLLHALAGREPVGEVRAIGPAGLLALLEPDLPGMRFQPWPSGAGARAELRAELRAWRPDVTLVLPPSFSSAWFALGTGAPRRIGYAGEARSWLLTDALPRRARGDLHASEEYLRLGARLGRAEGVPPLLPVPPATREAAGALLAGAGASGRRFALLGPGAAFGPAKRWPADRYAALAGRLASRGLATVLAGAAADAGACAEVAAAAPGVLDLAGRTDLATLAGLCAEATLVVCNDSGLGHLAAAIGTPTVAVFGSTSSAWTAPLGPRVRVVQRAPVCAPCFRPTCAIGYPCLEAVSDECVARACEEVAA